MSEQRKPREWWLVPFGKSFRWEDHDHVRAYDCPQQLSQFQIHVREVIEEDKKSTVQKMMEHATGFKND